eukprot:scaffold86165_cov45-Attheya_sp.AAC.2
MRGGSHVPFPTDFLQKTLRWFEIEDHFSPCSIRLGPEHGGCLIGQLKVNNQEFGHCGIGNVTHFSIGKEFFHGQRQQVGHSCWAASV